MGVGSSFWRRVVFLFVFQLPRWVIILFLSLTSGWGILVLFLFVFFLQNVQFSHHISRVRLIFFLSHRLVKCFAFFYFCLFVFILFCFVLFCFAFFASKNSTPLISNGAPLSLFYYTDDGGHYVIDNFEFPCNSVKNLIPIWNFTNTFIQECKIIWEFQIRWGETLLLRPLWRSWRYWKAYSLMSNKGRFQNFKNLIFFLHISVSPPLRSTIPKRN